ncbi:glutathione transferase 2 [Delphinella strobiligena]|nr:glutathione transferase 2 [Delphinella strobiligena]
MSTNIKPIKVWGEGSANPPKVVMILEELGLPYENIPVPYSIIKKPEYLKINPNGCIPSIYDPNTDLTLWESGAIIEYLVEKYDKDHKLSYPAGSNEAFQTKQWLFYQATGQGPYYGQAVWFTKYHEEKLPSAVERYIKEIHRVTGVLEDWLAQKKASNPGADGPWLVGDRLTYADIAFVVWQSIVAHAFKEKFSHDDFPHVKEWLDKLMSRPAVKVGLAPLQPAT